MLRNFSPEKIRRLRPYRTKLLTSVYTSRYIGVVEVHSSLLRYEVLSQDEYFPTFRRILTPSFSGTCSPRIKATQAKPRCYITVDIWYCATPVIPRPHTEGHFQQEYNLQQHRSESIKSQMIIQHRGNVACRKSVYYHFWLLYDTLGTWECKRMNVRKTGDGNSDNYL
jgi:hypothetical protein